MGTTPLRAWAAPEGPLLIPSMLPLFPLPFRSRLRTLRILNFQAELGQEIWCSSFPTDAQLFLLSRRRARPAMERRELRCHWLLPAGGRDIYIPLKDMPRFFPATWWAEICHWSLLLWQSVGCKFMERPRARKQVRKQCDWRQTSLALWRTQRQNDLATRQGLTTPAQGRRRLSKSPEGMKKMAGTSGLLLDDIQEPYFLSCPLLEDALQAATAHGDIHSSHPLLCWRVSALSLW